MSVHQHKDGRWIVKIYDATRPSKYRWEYFGRGPIAEAKARARDQALDFKPTRPRADEGSGPYFHELAMDYIAQRRFNPNSEKLCTLRVTSIIAPTLGNIHAIRLSYDDLDRYVSARKASVTKNSAHSKHKKTIRMSTIRRELTDIKAIMNWAAKRRPPLIPFNPIRDYQLPPDDDASIIPPTAAEVDAILKCANERLFRAIKIAWYTGLRPGAVELLSLRWDNVIWENMTIRITSADKGGVRRRDVPIHPDFAPELKTWRDKDNNPIGPIIHQNGQPIQRLNSAWRFAKKNAGITRRLRPYDLRHFFVTTALEAGNDYKTLSEIVGSSPETIRKHYQHVTSNAKISLISGMPKQGTKRKEKP